MGRLDLEEDMHLPQVWTGQFINTFCYYTIRDRMPVILTKVIDHFCRSKNHIYKQYGEEAKEELKIVLGELSKLKSELQTDKPISPLKDGLEDNVVWNQHLSMHQKLVENIQDVSWFKSPWLYIECYMYRRIAQAFWMTKHLNQIDWFRDQKETGFKNSITSINALGTHVMQLLQTIPEMPIEERLNNAIALIKVCLWGNKCDMSISAGDDKSAEGNPLHQLNDLEKNILVNHSRNIEEFLSDCKEACSKPLCWVMDNSGFELFTDFCTADYLCESGYFNCVEFFIKTLPWFVSDTVKHDVQWMLQELESCYSTPVLVQLAQRWKHNFNVGRWKLIEEPYWTYPHDFSAMSLQDPELYRRLGNGSLIIFKGDLNYRKLMGDLMWDTTVSFKTALRKFCPGPPILALRTLKAEVVVEISKETVEKLDKECPQWKVTGEYAVIQMTQ